MKNKITFLVLCLLTVVGIKAQTWNQIGQDIDGINANAYLGGAIDIDSTGNTIVIGNINNPTNGALSGYIKVLEYDGTNWVQKGSALYGQSGDEFGASVSINAAGDIIAVSSSGFDTLGMTDVGKVQMFFFNGTDWVKYGNQLVGIADYEKFGTPLDLDYSGKTIAVNAPNHYYYNYGSVYVYKYNSGLWNYHSRALGADYGTGYTGFGKSVSLDRDGTKIIIGSPDLSDGFNTDCGGVDVYELLDTNWNYSLQITGSDDYLYLGNSCALSGNGQFAAYGNPNGFSNSFAVYQDVGSGWVVKGSVTSSQSGNRFGNDISLSFDGLTVVTSASRIGSLEGELYVYKFSNVDNDYILDTAIIAENLGDQFGNKVGVNSNGDIALGSSIYNGDAFSNAGHIRVFSSKCVNTSSTDVQTACDNYSWVDGNTYTSSNNSATYTTTNAVGCDSIITLNLTITNSTSSTDVQTACNSYTWIDGNTYTSSNNTATFTTTNTAGCDSVITLDLTIENSNIVGDLDCNNTIDDGEVAGDANGNGVIDNGEVAGDTNGNGVIDNGEIGGDLNGNGIIDGDEVEGDLDGDGMADNVGVNELSLLNVMLYPNPTTGVFTIKGELGNNFTTSVFDMMGQEILTKLNTNTIDLSSQEVGIYFVEVKTKTEKQIVKLIKN